MASLRGFNVAQAARGGMRYWVVSDLNGEELRVFTQALTDPRSP